MKRLQTSFTSLKRRLSFGKADSGLLSRLKKTSDTPQQSKPKENTPNLSNISDDNIQGSSEPIEDIIFIHSYYGVKRLQKPNKKSHQIHIS